MWKILQKKIPKGWRILLRWRSTCTQTRYKRAANSEPCRLIFELSCDKETITAKLIDDEALVYKIVQEKFSVKINLQHSTVTTIFATDQPKPWSWSVIANFTATKQNYETTDATLAKEFERVLYTYRL